MTELQLLQDWYAGECNGDWEHQFGVRIETLDNPGWKLDIALHETSLADCPFDPITTERSENDWIHCKVVDCVFQSRGGPKNLAEMLRAFLAWAAVVPARHHSEAAVEPDDPHSTVAAASGYDVHSRKGGRTGCRTARRTGSDVRKQPGTGSGAAMNRSTALGRLTAAIDACTDMEGTAEAEQFPGLAKVRSTLEAMHGAVQAGGEVTGNTGIGRHVTDQWPFTELGEKVLSAVEACEAMAD